MLRKQIECSACGETQMAGYQDSIFNDGWVMDSRRFGYYSGFDDELFVGEDEQREEWLLCHDCVVMLLEAFPRLGATVKKGSHPTKNEDGTPCCKWAWKNIEKQQGSMPYTVQLVDEDGEWYDVPSEG